MKKHKGFTLIELMITILVVAILASIAIPSYRQYVIRANRTAAQATMMEIATRQQQYLRGEPRPMRPRPTSASCCRPRSTRTTTSTSTLMAGPPPGFRSRSTATDSQASDGDLTLNSEGVKGPAGKWK